MATAAGRKAMERAPAPNGRIKVRAIEMGYYDHIRRREGDVFTISNEKEFSERWMERVDASTPDKVTSAPEHLRQQHENIRAASAPGVMADEGTGGANVLG